MAFDVITGKILGIGSDSQILGKFGDFGSTQANLQLQTVLPGFIDSHGVRARSSFQRVTECRLIGGYSASF